MPTAKHPAKPAYNDPQELYPAYNPTTQTWDDLQEGAVEILGYDHLKDEDLDALAGVPFMITQVVFRPSDMTSRKNYVTVQAVIAPKEVLEKRHVKTDNIPFDAEDQVLFNDGSTGIYRQIVAILAAREMIILPEPINPQGKAGESSYDLAPDEWQDIAFGNMQYSETGQAIYTANLRVFCKRGIRISDGYENEWTKDGKTRYLA